MSSSSSFSSISSDSSDYIDLSDRARQIIDLLYEGSDLTTATSIVSPDVIVQRDDEAPTTTLSALLDCRFNTAKSAHLQMHISEAIVDEQQRKVWVQCEISGVAQGLVKEIVHMMTFDEASVLIRDDCQRVRRRRSE